MTKIRFEEDHIVIIDTNDGVIDVLTNTPENQEVVKAYIKAKRMNKSKKRKDSWFADALKNTKD